MGIAKLTEEDFVRAAVRLGEGVEVAAVKAVQEVETGGRGGFFAPGKPAILFEGHIFWKRIEKLNFNPEPFRTGNEDILYPTGGRGHYKGGLREYERLEKALALAATIGGSTEERHALHGAALESASWGMFQIMGFNYGYCGYRNVWAFVEAMKTSEGAQLDAFVSYILRRKLAEPLKQKRWAVFAEAYNGRDYKVFRYDEKLQQAYEKYC